jgi:hypothetical protein
LSSHSTGRGTKSESRVNFVPHILGTMQWPQGSGFSSVPLPGHPRLAIVASGLCFVTASGYATPISTKSASSWKYVVHLELE